MINYHLHQCLEHRRKIARSAKWCRHCILGFMYSANLRLQAYEFWQGTSPWNYGGQLCRRSTTFNSGGLASIRQNKNTTTTSLCRSNNISSLHSNKDRTSAIKNLLFFRNIWHTLEFCATLCTCIKLLPVCICLPFEAHERTPGVRRVKATCLLHGNLVNEWNKTRVRRQGSPPCLWPLVKPVFRCHPMTTKCRLYF